MLERLKKVNELTPTPSPRSFQWFLHAPVCIPLPSVLVASYLSFKPLGALKPRLPWGKEVSLPVKGFSVGSPTLISVFLLALSTPK